MKKKIILKKNVSVRKLLFMLQVVVLSPVLLPLILVDLVCYWLLGQWSKYREWFLRVNR